ncbi:fumarylacetoacetate hydrolase family protein [Phenylobacterium sp. SCN 70-31]|uniref:2-keto-4-pentenoate hydratase n=1 Tax=Phenylobacterium sp. SCN 70-31 TaxID=1660129 RepID=UPI000ADA3A67|nr:fumarylacetoacetate hydrolase family protein [Phenylobacterium sp. SCN 70-31]
MSSKRRIYADLAARLRQAYATGPVAPLRDGLATSDADGAYEIQHLNTRYWMESGRRVVGRKVGLTSDAVQKQLGVSQPDFGVLFEDMRLTDGGSLAASRTIQPKVEAEVAIILANDLDSAEATAEDVLAAADCAVAAIEIVDSRISDWQISFADTVADNGSSAFFVLGSEFHSLSGLDLRTCGMAMEINGKVVSLGAGVACLGHPLNSAAWLARTLSAHGTGLKAGDIVLTGALGPMATLAPGDLVRAEIGGLGSVGFTFGDDRS